MCRGNDGAVPPALLTSTRWDRRSNARSRSSPRHGPRSAVCTLPARSDVLIPVAPWRRPRRPDRECRRCTFPAQPLRDRRADAAAAPVTRTVRSNPRMNRTTPSFPSSGQHPSLRIHHNFAALVFHSMVSDDTAVALQSGRTDVTSISLIVADPNRRQDFSVPIRLLVPDHALAEQSFDQP